MKTRQPFDPELNAVVRYLCDRMCPQGFDTDPDAPQTLEGLEAYVQENGRICVWEGDYGDSIFACPETDRCFMAWHDWHHYAGCLTFDRAGETEAWRRHMTDIERLTGKTWGDPQFDRWARILHARLVGQFDYNERWGCDPDFSKGFAQHYYKDPAGAVATRRYVTRPDAS